MTTQEAIEILAASNKLLNDQLLRLKAAEEITGYKAPYQTVTDCEREHEAVKIAIAALKQNQEGNARLALDELRGMDGEAVWCEDVGTYGVLNTPTDGQWANKPFLLCYDRGVPFQADIEHRDLKLYRHKL